MKTRAINFAWNKWFLFLHSRVIIYKTRILKETVETDLSSIEWEDKSEEQSEELNWQASLG